MSDFLSNLIARSFTDAPVIRPRVPSLFEKTADEFPGERESPTPAISAHETIAPTPVPKSLPGGETAITKSVANGPDAVAEESLPKPNTPAHEKPPVIAQARRPNAEAVEVEKVEVKTNKVTVPPDSFRDGERDAGNKRGVSGSFSEPLAIQPRRRKGFSPLEQRSSTSAPTIRVTIGRVEVRAIHPAPPVPKPAKPSTPKLSLEDYLHKRERGAR
jgi:hypothetical protein